MRLLTTDTPDWTGALCARFDPEAWFPPDKTDELPPSAVAAKRVCRSCPLRAACFEFAVEANVRHGIWGGRRFTAHTASRERRRRPRDARETAAA